MNILELTNVLSGLKFKTETIDLQDEIGFYNIGKESPLLYDVLIGEMFLPDNEIRIEVYFYSDNKSVQIIYQTNSKEYNNDFRNFSNKFDLIQDIYKWLQFEKGRVKNEMYK